MGAGGLEKTNMLRTVRNFAVAAGLALLAGGGILVLLLDDMAVERLVDTAERGNVALTHSLANGLRRSFAPLIEEAAGQPADRLRANPRVATLHAEVLAQLRGLDVVKIKIYLLDGTTVFSTEPVQIGEDKSGNAGFRAGRAGQVASELTHRGQFSAFEGVIENRDLLSSYVPIRLTDHANGIDAVFEIYTDVTQLLAEVHRTKIVVAFTTGATFFAIYLVLLLVVSRANRLAAAGHRENLRLAAMIARAEATSAMKSSFLANISHEIRTPLNAVIGFSEMMTLGYTGALTGQQHRCLSDIHASGEHLRLLVDDLLDMARMEAGHIDLREEPTDLGKTVAAALRLVRDRARAKRIALSVDLPPPAPLIQADPARLRQILVNLLSNAIKFTPEGGSVSLTAREAENGDLIIAIRDSGIGISPGDLAHVVEPFGQVRDPMRRSEEGTGLGLPIARHLIEAHGGSLAIESEMGRGTMVTLRFPAKRRIAEPQHARVSA
jgi:signal transduction histidine kinase